MLWDGIATHTFQHSDDTSTLHLLVSYWQVCKILKSHNFQQQLCPKFPAAFGHLCALEQVSAGRKVALTDETENQGNSGLVRDWRR